MNLSKQFFSLLLAGAMLLSLAACGVITSPDGPTEVIVGSTQPEVPPEDAPPAEETYTVRAAALKGPTAMGLVKLMKDAESGDGQCAGSYEFTLAGSADEVTPLLIKGDLDVACVPANLAAVLFNRTGGEIVTLAVNTLGVLYIVENGGSVQDIGDLRGRAIVSAGKGSTPEFGLRYLLEQNGLDPDKDVTIDWKSEHSECVAALASGAAAVAMLPQPFVTVAQGKIEGLRVALDLTEEWDALDNGSAMITGVAAARRDFVENHPDAVEDFLLDYAESTGWVTDNVPEAAALIGEYGIVEAAVAEKALPYCNIVCITGQDMADKLSGYLQVLYEADPDSVGGALPEGDFCYGA